MAGRRSKPLLRVRLLIPGLYGMGGVVGHAFEPWVGVPFDGVRATSVQPFYAAQKESRFKSGPVPRFGGEVGRKPKKLPSTMGRRIWMEEVGLWKSA